MPRAAHDQVYTYCRICEAACGLVAERDAQGRVARLRPDRDHPVSRGYVCQKGTRFHEVAHHPDRLVEPLVRRSTGQLTPVAWSEATRTIGTALASLQHTYGPHSVGVYVGNPTAFNALGALGTGLFLSRLGTRNVFSAGSQDCNNKFAGSAIVHGSPIIQPIPDFERADLAVLFGTNPAVSQSSFVHLPGGASVFDRILARGGRVICVDPRHTESARRWGGHLAIRPGTDVFLLLALLDAFRAAQPQGHSKGRVIGLERLLELAAEYPAERAAELTGMGADAIGDLAEAIREADRAALHMSVGVNQGPFGTLAYVALQALSYLSGNFDREGGHLFHPLAWRVAQVARRLGLDRDGTPSRIGGFDPVLETLPGGILADEILTPGRERLRALVVIAGDPLRSIPGEPRLREALSRLDLLVCIDLFENRTGALAHVLLPATSWLERWDVATTTLVLQTGGLLQSAGAAEPPVGEARSELRILCDILADASGRLSPRRALWRALGRLPWEQVLTRLSRLGALTHRADLRYGLRVPGPRAETYLGRGPRTPGHVVRFWDVRLEGEGARLRRHAAQLIEAAGNGSFLLMGRRRRIGHNGWLHRGTRDGREREAAWMAPSDLAELGVTDGASIRVAAEGTGLELPVEGRAEVSPGTIVIAHGLRAANANALIPSGPGRLEPLSGQHWMTGIPVSVKPAEP